MTALFGGAHIGVNQLPISISATSQFRAHIVTALATTQKAGQKRHIAAGPAVSKICDGFPVFDSENQYLIALRELLKYTMQDQYDYIGWWLYEAPDAGYTVWWDDEDGKEIRVDLTEPGALYDYLVEYAAPEGVQEDEL